MSQGPMPLRCRAFALPKLGNSREECEDASSFDCARGRFAVADGASETAFAGEWAALLCESYVAGDREAADLQDWRDELRQRWLTAVNRDGLPWYLEQKLQEGAFATFLGLCFQETSGLSRSWRALAIGDSCLFHARGNELQHSFPLTKAGEFGTRPHLIGSRQRAEAVAAVAAGTLENGDLLLLMTDALAEWFLRDHEAGGKPWLELARLRTDEFEHWVNGLREARKIKNDDVTLLVIDLEAPVG
jgi:serine/threonine protein phosphatase PrpC